MQLGLGIHSALINLGAFIEPRLGRPGLRYHPWAGLVIVALLVAGIVFIAEGAIGAMQAALPHREQRP